MLMITITTLTNSFIINGLQFNKGSLGVSPTKDGAKIGYFYDKLENITVDGVKYTTYAELNAALDTKLFKVGGGDGSGVAGLQWSDTSMMPVAGKVPVFSDQGLLSTGMPLFPENAVPLIYVDTNFGRYLGVYNTLDALNAAHPLGKTSSYAHVRDVDSTGDILKYYYWSDLAESWETLSVDKDDLYSKVETLTNKIWHDGKKVYRQLYTFSAAEGNNELPTGMSPDYSIVNYIYTVTIGNACYSNSENIDLYLDGGVIKLNSTFTDTINVELAVEYTK